VSDPAGALPLGPEEALQAAGLRESGAEQVGSAGADMADRRAVKLWEAVEGALHAGY
jgi:hypothetical protein